MNPTEAKVIEVIRDAIEENLTPDRYLRGNSEYLARVIRTRLHALEAPEFGAEPVAGIATQVKRSDIEGHYASDPPRCLDGSHFHDFEGKPVCRCGFTGIKVAP